MKNVIQLTLILSCLSIGTYAQQGMGVGNNNPLEMLDVSGAIKIGTDLTNTAAAPTGGAGTVRFRSGQFEGWDGSAWVPFTGGGGADSDWTISGNNQYSAVSGNVGIGTTTPGAKLEVAGQVKITGGTPGANKILTSDAAGLASWVDPGTIVSGNTLDGAYDEGGAGAGRQITADNGAVRVNGDDGFIVTGTFNSGDAIEVAGAGTRMFFNPRKAAFRAGTVNNGNWDDTNIGQYSAAFGLRTLASGPLSFAAGIDTKATGDRSTAFGVSSRAIGYASLATGSEAIASGDVATAMGFGTVASGDFSTTMGRGTDATALYATAMGWDSQATGERSLATGRLTVASGFTSFAGGHESTASGDYSTALGSNLTAKSGYEMVVGRYNTDYTPVSTTGWNAADRLFVVGNGTGNTARSNALTIYKNGTININDAYSLPNADGTNGYIMSTDGSGSVSWTDPGSLVSNDGDWTVSGNNQYSAVSGNVGIGETNPIFKLDVGHPGANQQLRVRGNWVSNHANNARANFIDWNFGVGAGRAGSAGDATVIWSYNGVGRGILFASTSNGLSQHFGQMQHNMYIDGSSGNVGIGNTSPTAKLEVAGQVKITGGTPGANKILTSDANGLATWQAPASAVFGVTSGVTSNENGTYSSDDYVFGSPQLADDGNTAHDARMFFDKSKGAFRSGLVTDTKWDDVNVGSYSTGLGYNTTAPGFVSTALGNNTTAYGYASTALGNNTTALGSVSTALGNNTTASGIISTALGSECTASGTYAVAMGYLSTASGSSTTTMGANTTSKSGYEMVVGRYNTDYTPASTTGWNAADRLFVVGNGTSSGALSNALTIYKDGTMNINDAYDMPTADGTSGQVLTTDGSGVLTFADPSTGSSLADGDGDTQIQVEESSDEDHIRFDTFGSERMVIDNNGNIGVGTSSPVNLLHIQNNASGLNFPLFLRNSSISNGDGAGIGFLSEPNGNWTKAGIYYERTGGFGTGKLHFLVDDVADNGTVTLSESRLTIKPNGDVGMGTTDPSRNLDVYEDVNGTVSIRIENPNTGANSVERLSFDNEDGGVAAIALYDNDSGAYPSQMRIFNNRPNGSVHITNTGSSGSNISLIDGGNVGIGTETPTLAKLQILGGIRSYDVGLGNSSNTDGVRGYANFSSDNHATVVVGQNLYSNGGVFRIANTHGSLSGSGLIIPGNGQPGQGNLYFLATPTGSVTSGATIGGVGTAEMVLTTGGRLGIGTTSPIAPLHVEPQASANYGNFTFYALNQYTNTPNNPTSCCGGLVNGISIHASGRVMASEFDAFSDARIKNVIGVSNTEEDLQRLLGIEITDYRMKDKAKDVKPYKKVIAQQVEEVYPEAVSTITEVVPDIYTLASVENGFVTVTADVELGDKVRLIRESGNEMVTVTRVDENGFMTDTEITEDVFVYGREVDDFRAVDYEAISMLNVSATQELFKMIQELRDRNSNLEEKLSDYSTLKSDVELLKEALGIDLQTSK